MYPQARSTGKSLESKGANAPFFLQKPIVHLVFKISDAIARGENIMEINALGRCCKRLTQNYEAINEVVRELRLGI